MKKCVESGPITPMQKEWVQKIVHMIPERLRNTPYMKECISDLFDEIKTDFSASMQKSMGIPFSSISEKFFQEMVNRLIGVILM